MKLSLNFKKGGNKKKVKVKKKPAGLTPFLVNLIWLGSVFLAIIASGAILFLGWVGLKKIMSTDYTNRSIGNTEIKLGTSREKIDEVVKYLDQLEKDFPELESIPATEDSTLPENENDTAEESSTAESSDDSTGASSEMVVSG